MKLATPQPSVVAAEKSSFAANAAVAENKIVALTAAAMATTRRRSRVVLVRVMSKSNRVNGAAGSRRGEHVLDRSGENQFLLVQIEPMRLLSGFCGESIRSRE